MYECTHRLGPSNNIIKFTRVDEIHCHNTRYAQQGNLYINSVRSDVILIACESPWLSKHTIIYYIYIVLLMVVLCEQIYIFHISFHIVLSEVNI